MSNKLCCATMLLTSPPRRSTRPAHRILPERASIRFPRFVARPRALRRLFFFSRLLAARLRPLVEIGHAAIQNRRDCRVGLRPLLGLVGHHWILDETANQALERVVGALELSRMMDRAGRTRLAAKPAVHALFGVA